MKDEYTIQSLCEKIVELSTHRRQLLKAVSELSEVIGAISTFEVLPVYSSRPETEASVLLCAKLEVALSRLECVLIERLGDDTYYSLLDKARATAAEDLIEEYEEAKSRQ